MRLRKGTPGEGAEAGADNFSYTGVQHGTKGAFSAYIAGDTYWCLAHEHNPPAFIGTKPCLAWISHKELLCPFCRRRGAPTWVGYVPLYREQDHSPIIIIVGKKLVGLAARAEVSGVRSGREGR